MNDVIRVRHVREEQITATLGPGPSGASSVAGPRLRWELILEFTPQMDEMLRSRCDITALAYPDDDTFQPSTAIAKLHEQIAANGRIPVFTGDIARSVLVGELSG